MTTPPSSATQWPRPPRSRFPCVFIVIPAILLAGCFKKPQASQVPLVTAPPFLQPIPETPKPPPNLSVRKITLGYSVQGKPLTMHVFGSGPNPVLIFGGIHGREPTSAQLAKRLLAFIRQNPQIWVNDPIAILPAANPDGLAKGIRQNINGVDCNRNFPATNWRKSRPGNRYYGGPRPLSEPETRAIVKAVRILQPRFIVAIHSIGGERFCNNYDGPAQLLAEIMARRNHYPVKATMGYSTPGSFGSWAGIDQNIPTITLELPREKPLRQVWLSNRNAILAAIQTHIGR